MLLWHLCQKTTGKTGEKTQLCDRILAADAQGFHQLWSYFAEEATIEQPGPDDIQLS